MAGSSHARHPGHGGRRQACGHGGTIVMVGTRKGLWIGRSDEAREEWEFNGPHFDMEEVYSCLVDKRGDTPRLLDRRELELAGSPGLALRRPRRQLGGDPQRRDPLSRGQRGDAGAGLAAGARCHRRGRVRRHRARRGLEVHRPGRDVRPRAGPLGPPRTARVGCRIRRPGVPHDPAAPDRPPVRDGRHLDGRRLPDDRRRRELAGPQPGHHRGVPAGGRAVPRLRPVRAQGHPPPGPPRAALPPEPRRRLPLRRRGRDLEVHRRRTARRLRVPDRRPSPRARHRLRLPARRRRRPVPTRRQGPGLALPRRGGDLGGARARGCPRRSTSA